MQFLIDPIQFGLFHTTIAEMIAVCFGLTSVWFMKKEHILVYPFGIVNVLIYVYICYAAGLYAYAGINGFYFIMSVYGWFNWLRKNKKADRIRITACSWKELIIYILLTGIIFLLLRWALLLWTNSVVPAWDALTTSIYIIGMWLLAMKKIENWLFWILGDIISVGLFAYEQLYFSCLQFSVFTIIAILGYREWKRKLSESP